MKKLSLFSSKLESIIIINMKNDAASREKKSKKTFFLKKIHDF